MDLMTDPYLWSGQDRTLTVEDMENMPDDEFRLVTNLRQFVLEVASLPFDNQRRELPAEVLPQSLVGWLAGAWRCHHQQFGQIRSRSSALARPAVSLPKGGNDYDHVREP